MGVLGGPDPTPAEVEVLRREHAARKEEKRRKRQNERDSGEMAGRLVRSRPSEQQRRSVRTWRLGSFIAVLISWVLLGIAVGIYARNAGLPVLLAKNRFLCGMLTVAALAFACYILRGPSRRYGRSVTLLAIFTAALCYAFIGVLFVLPRDIYFTLNLLAVLEAAAVGIIALGISLLTIMTWISGWVFAEPLALGLLSVALGVICWAGVQASVKPLTYPPTNGAAFLFVTHPAQQMRLTVQTSSWPFPFPNPISGSFPATTEGFTINNSNKGTERWALLLVGDARLIGLRSKPAYRLVQTRDISVLDIPALAAIAATASDKTQLVTGTLAPGGSVGIGPYDSSGQFINRAIDRTAVALPIYGEGNISDFRGNVRGLVAGTLGAAPYFIPASHFALTVVSTRLLGGSLLTYSQPTVSINGPSGLKWSGHSALTIYYETTYPFGADVKNASVFIFGILLGVSGAGLIGSFQAGIHTSLSRGQPHARGDGDIGSTGNSDDSNATTHRADAAQDDTRIAESGPNAPGTRQN